MEQKNVEIINNEYHCNIDITVEEWRTLLKNENVFNEKSLDVIKKWYNECDYKSSCKEMSIKYGKACNYYNTNVWQLGKRVIKHLNRFSVNGIDGEATYWIAIMKGRYGKKYFQWQLRDELVEALNIEKFNFKINRETKSFIIPFDGECYDIDEAWKKDGEIIWKQVLRNNIELNDIVYIYNSKIQKIQYKCRIKELNSKKKNEDDCFNNEEIDKKGIFKWMILDEVENVEIEEFNFKHLKENGLNNKLQNQQEIKGELFDYIKNVFQKKKKVMVSENDIIIRNDTKDVLIGIIEEEKFKKVYVHEKGKRKKTEYKKKNDYISAEINKIGVGIKGEEAILRYEKDYLKEKGLIELSERAKIVESDSFGYDIVSFNEDGTEKHIEVKTNSTNNKYIEFFISENEKDKLMTDDKYVIYYLSNIKSKTPKFKKFYKKDLKEEYFKPVSYRVELDCE